MSEYANRRTRGAFIAAVFTMQGLGNLAAGTMVLAISARFKSTRAYETDPFGQADYVWRIVLMLGAVPALLTYYWRMKMPETARYTALIAKNLKQAASDMTSVLEIEIPSGKEEMDALAIQDEFGLFSMEFVHRYGRELLSTTMHHVLAIIVLAGTLPGYLFTVIFIDKLGRTRIQIVGFTMMTILMLCLAGPYNFWSNNKTTQIGFAFMYALIFFFSNFGPNSTTFILPTEIFPTRLRSTCHGISGAGGKIGAIIGVLWFLRCPTSIQNSLLMLACCNLVGVIFTLALPESKDMSLEDITGEIDQQDEKLPLESPQIDGGEFIHSVDFL